jgi:organic hydroperoxide reductase OsmC/OhrA
MHFLAKPKKLDATGCTVDPKVDIDLNESGFFLAVALSALERAVAEEPVAAAQQACPYSKATFGNISVTLLVA